VSAPVFVTDPGTLDGVAPGGSFTLRGPEARHAVVVRRIRTGEHVEVVDGAGVRIGGDVTGVAGGSGPGLEIAVTDVLVEPGPRPSIVLVQALAKGSRDELAIEAATEVGLDGVIPWQSERSVAQWRGEKASKGRARWEQVVLAAAKQSRRAWVPVVSELVTGAELRTLVAELTGAGSVVLVLHEDAGLPFAGADIGPDAERVLLVVGPEGGLSEAEVTALAAAGAQPVRLGPHVLRTSTAGPVAVAALAQRLGRWDIAR
jgi:16S rRNA (uracil1498-N3)-methyltransferase